MCVAGSQKPMQAAIPLPPPPGVLGLAPLRVGEPDRSTPLDPPVANWSGSCGRDGAIVTGSSCRGGRPSEGPVDGVSGVNGVGPVPLMPVPEVLGKPRWLDPKPPDMPPLPVLVPAPRPGANLLGAPGIVVAAEPGRMVVIEPGSSGIIA
jgi:hypothetical protein